MGFLADKRALVMGVASNRSIAWGIAQALHSQGAELAFTYQNDKLKKRVVECAKLCKSELVFECDVGNDNSIQQVFGELNQSWQNLDCLVHSVAFAERSALNGNYLEVTTRENFLNAHDISSLRNKLNVDGTGDIETLDDLAGGIAPRFDLQAAAVHSRQPAVLGMSLGLSFLRATRLPVGSGQHDLAVQLLRSMGR